MKELKDFIVVMNNIMPPPVINQIMDEYKNCIDWETARVASGENTDIRNCKTLGISYNGIIEKNQEARYNIDQLMFRMAGNALNQYKLVFSDCVCDKDSGYELLKYDEGGFYKQHTDSYSVRPRSLACSFILNDDFEGGEFAFFNRELIFKLKKGSCILFPSSFMYPHEIMPVTKGTRYSIITWFI